jgi:NAD-dependent deacetylase
MMNYKNIVILTGAGISQESGIETFRASNGLWENHNVEDVATPEGFVRNPDLVYGFYNKRRRQLLSKKIQPNPAHKALVELENACSGEFSLVTQNVDDLHERSGSKNVFHMHGELLSALCSKTNKRFAWKNDLTADSENPSTGEKRCLRPDIVWFGEQPYYLDEIYQALASCSLFIAIGTSGQIYPAANFVQEVQMNQARTIEVNLEVTEISPYFQEHYYGPASVEVPKLVRALLG